MQQKPHQFTAERRTLIIVAVILSIVLYLAGALSGLYASKLIEERTKEDIGTLQSKTERDMQLLKDYITILDSNVKDMQLEQVFSRHSTTSRGARSPQSP